MNYYERRNLATYLMREYRNNMDDNYYYYYK